jgi:hypothetical protein
MSARCPHRDDLKDSKKDEEKDEDEERGVQGMAEDEAASEFEVLIGKDADKRAADGSLNAESSRESKKRRVSTNEASMMSSIPPQPLQRHTSL